MNICIFPGTFNPIHIAHIKMAEFVLDKYNFEKIIFIPSYIPPHKQLENNLAKHRLNMVEFVCSKNPKFEVSDIEYRREGKSYTIYTVKELKKIYSIEEKLNLLIGTDAFSGIKSWYHTDELKEMVHFLVYPRGCDIINEEDFSGYSYEILNAKKFDVSSTKIRETHKGQVIKEVEEYINKNELYY